MDSAIVLCAFVASISLALGAVGAVPPIARRVATAHIPLPVRSVAAIVAMASLFAFTSRPRPAVASVEPPVVRLANAPTTESGEEATPKESPATRTARPITVRDRETAGPNTSHVVRPGDCLWHIARSVLAERAGKQPTTAEIARFWPAIYAANRAVIGDDPNLIFPGQHLDIPER